MTAPHDAWLRRVSDYQSGGVSAAERAAVEDHLRACAECQEALAMYRRYYTLLRSPLALGAPSAAFDETTAPISAPPPAAPARQPHRPGGPPRDRRWIAGAAAVVAAAVIIAGFVAVIGPRLRAPTASVTPSPRATTTAQGATTPTAEPQTTQTPTPSAFVCANPASSNMVYAYTRADANLYMVSGCSAPRHVAGAYTLALGWSPGNRYLAIMINGFPQPGRVDIFDTQTNTTWETSFVTDFGNDDSLGRAFSVYFGWIDASTILVGKTTIIHNPQQLEAPGPTTLSAVNVVSHDAHALGAIKTWANFGGSAGGPPVRIVAKGRYLYYAASDSSGETSYLHRFDLTTGVDTRLVSLGLFTNGGCQGTPICMWTTPWDVSSDGAHILYHHPGATSSPSDTGSPKDTPLFYANPDGSHAIQLFGSQLADTLVAASFAPNGQLAVISGSWTGAPNPFGANYKIKIATIAGAVKTIDGSFSAWRGDSAALVLTAPGGETTPPPPALYDLQSGATTPLEAGSNWYLWGN